MSLPDWTPRYLEAYVETGNVKVAAKVASVSRSTIYWWMGRSAAFRLLVEKARSRRKVAILEGSRRAVGHQ